MRAFYLLLLVVLATVGIGVAAIGLESPREAATVDQGTRSLPRGLVQLADTVIGMAEHHDVDHLARLSSLGVLNNPTVFETKALFESPGEFGNLIELLTTSTPATSPYLPDWFVWNASGSSWWLSGQSRARTLRPRFGGLEVSFGKNQGHWELLSIGMPPAETFAPFGVAHRFTGEWSAHDRFLTVNPNGSVVLSARGFGCPADDTACQDHIVGNEIIDGANAVGRITHVVGATATLVIRSSTLRAQFPLGTATMTYRPSTDSITVGGFTTVCGPHGTPRICGA